MVGITQFRCREEEGEVDEQRPKLGWPRETSEGRYPWAKPPGGELGGAAGGRRWVGCLCVSGPLG